MGNVVIHQPRLYPLPEPLYCICCSEKDIEIKSLRAIIERLEKEVQREINRNTGHEAQAGRQR